jgi:hypothetical protein
VDPFLAQTSARPNLQADADAPQPQTADADAPQTDLSNASSDDDSSDVA